MFAMKKADIGTVPFYKTELSQNEKWKVKRRPLRQALGLSR